MALQEHLLSSLRRVLATDQVVASPVELVTYEVDGGLDRGRPDGAVFPQTADDVVRIVQWACTHGVPLIARGAGTGLSGGAVPEHGGLIVEFSRMREVVEVDEAGRSAVVQPGVVTQSLDVLLKTRGMYYPPDPSSGRCATIGGNIAENSGGPHCFKYGVTANYITGLQVVLANGHLVQLDGRALDYPEYDFAGLVTGSEGTLGLVVKASIRLLRTPPAVKTLMAAFDSVEVAGAAVSAIIARGLIPAAIEMMDQQIMGILEEYTHAGLPIDAAAALIIEADGYVESVSPQIDEIAAILRDYTTRELRVAQTAAERDAIWYARKSAAGAIARLAPFYYMIDVTVPRSTLAAMLAGCNQICAAHALRVGYVLHAGDGNLHPLILIDDPADHALMARVHAAGRQIVELCLSFNGSITGEHGVGIEKREYMPLMYSPAELDVMRDVKAVFDPQQLLNPGKIFPLVDGDGRRVDGAGTHDIDHRPAVAGHPSGEVLRPASAEEVAATLQACITDRRSIRVRGGGTKSGLLPPADVLLATKNLHGIRTYARDDLYITVGVGTSLADLQAELAPDRLWVPLLSPWPAATIGGIIATSTNAPLRMRYGGVRDLVLAATVALADGRVIRAGRAVVKNVAGYDLPKLFIGSHGTLGVIADVTLKLTPLPRARASVIVPVDTLERGLALGARLLRVCLVASAVLLCRGGDTPFAAAAYTLIYTAEGLAEDVRAELAEVRSALKDLGASGVIVDAPAGSDVWAAWLGGAAFGSDAAASPDALMRIGVAPNALPGIVSELVPMLGDAPFVADLANGLLYTRGVQDIAAVRRSARTAGGYAVVLAAAPALHDAYDVWGKRPDALDLMHALKARWDPHSLLNPSAFLV